MAFQYSKAYHEKITHHQMNKTICLDPGLTQSALTCIAASMSVEPNNSEVLKLLATSNMPAPGPGGGDEATIEDESTTPTTTNTTTKTTTTTTTTTTTAEGDISDENSWVVIYCLQQLTKASQGRPKFFYAHSICNILFSDLVPMILRITFVVVRNYFWAYPPI